MCPSCEVFAERRTFKAPEDYVGFVRQLIAETNNGNMVVIYADCALEALKDAPPWPTGDTILHEIQCTKCSQLFQLYANVWNGRTWWEPQTVDQWENRRGNRAQ